VLCNVTNSRCPCEINDGVGSLQRSAKLTSHLCCSVQSAAVQSPAPSTAKRKKNRKSGAIDPPAADSSPATSNGGTAAGSEALDAPSLVALSASLVAVVGWEAASSGAGGAQSGQSTGRLRAVVVDTLYGTVQAVHRRAFASHTGSASVGRAGHAADATTGIMCRLTEGRA